MRMANTETGDSFEEAGTGPEQPVAGAQQQIREVKDQVVAQAKSSFRQARDRATSSLGESRDHLADQIGVVARGFRRTGEHLRSENQERVAQLAESVARQGDRIADYLRTIDPRTTKEDLERVARRQPALVLAGAFALGLLGARFLKSSRRRDGGSQTPRDGFPGGERGRMGYPGSLQSGIARTERAPTITPTGETNAWS